MRPLKQKEHIIGGGVAGMEAARVAALSGRPVTLVESGPELGGAVLAASNGHGRERLRRASQWLESECRRLGVTITKNTSVDAAAVADVAAAQDVIIATGARCGVPSFAVTRAAQVVDAATMLTALSNEDPDPLVGVSTVLIWDPIGGPIAVSLAESLARFDVAVVFVTPDNIVGNELSRSGDLAPANARLQQLGVAIERRSLLRQAKKGVAVLEDRYTGVRRNVAVQLVIDAGHRLAEDQLFEAVSAESHTGSSAGMILRAGDAVAPRTILEAIREARGAVLALDGLVEVSDGVPMGTGGSH